MNPADLVQGSEEWFKARAGRCTASKFKDVLAAIKVGEAAGRRNYRVQLVTERLTGIPIEGYRNDAMQWGNDTEAAAREAYEAETGSIVTTPGLILGEHWVGCSPDGLIGDDGGCEIKCPYVSTVHVETLEDDKVPSDHVAQIQGSLWVTGRKWWDFVSFDPRMPENLRLFIKRVERDEDYIKKLAAEVAIFLKQVDAMHKRILAR